MLIQLANAITARRFRTDLRLRPDAGATQVAISTEAAALYYESMGQNWERAAFIRARACAGDIAAGEAFLAAIRPFVWRKSLDFGAIAEVGRLSGRIRLCRDCALKSCCVSVRWAV